MAIATARSRTRAARDSGSFPPSVLAVVVTHEGRRWLKDCLVALNAQTYPSLDVLVVDDASPDWRDKPHLKRVVKRHITKRRWGFLRTRRPLGFGGAINWAMSRVRTDADLLLFLHDDAGLDERSVAEMVGRMMLDTGTAIVGPKVVGWDDPQHLEEVGMAVDRFGYPYKGLERDEIDLGQHDAASEVFFVTSTCMLVRHAVFRNLRGWDARMRAFSEDLDLCWRARLAGHAVVVEPRARARHAVALATGARRSRFVPTRYFSRRNRLRAVVKNASALRLLGLVPQFVVLTLAEMAGFVLLRQPGEIANLAKALAWNVISAPQTFSERLRVQRARRLPDRRLRRLMVRDATRVRSYVGAQTERLEHAWGRRAETLARRSDRARAVSRSLAGWPLAAAFLLVAGVALGLRHFLLAPPATVGELLPYPPGAGTLWRALLSPWRDVGLGQPGPGPPAFALLGAFPFVGLGAGGAAQKALVLVLGGAAFVGAYRLLSEVADRPARVAAGVVYALGPVGYAALREGALGALVLGAAMPFAVRALLRLTAWVRPPGWGRGRAIARLAIAGAVGAAFVPGSLALVAGAGAVLGALRLVLGPRAEALRGLAAAAAGVALGWALLLPWSSTWLEPGGPLSALAGAGWRAHAARFDGHGMASVLLGQTPEAPPLVGLGAVVLALLGLALGGGQRRRAALALAGVLVASGGFVALVARGVVRPPVASPVEAAVLSQVALAGLAGLGVAAFRLDLPRRRLGAVHALALAALCAAAASFLVGVVPTMWRGEWTPGRAVGAPDPEVGAQIRSLLLADVDAGEGFRVLWAGGSGEASGSGRPARALPVVTGPAGPSLADLFARPGPGDRALAEVVASVEAGTTDGGGHLLGAFNVRYVVVPRAPGAGLWLAQRDLAVLRSEPAYTLLLNEAVLPRAAAYDRLPPDVAALAEGSEASAGAAAAQDAEARRSSTSSFAAAGVAGPGAVWLAETTDPRWDAELDDDALERVEGAWGNAFALPGGRAGELRLDYARPRGQIASLLAVGLAWAVALGAAFSGPPAPAAGPVRP